MDKIWIVLKELFWALHEKLKCKFIAKYPLFEFLNTEHNKHENVCYMECRLKCVHYIGKCILLGKKCRKINVDISVILQNILNRCRNNVVDFVVGKISQTKAEQQTLPSLSKLYLWNWSTNNILAINMATILWGISKIWIQCISSFIMFVIPTSLCYCSPSYEIITQGRHSFVHCFQYNSCSQRIGNEEIQDSLKM